MTEQLRTSAPIEALELSARARESCLQAGARTIGDVLALTEEEFCAQHGCGPKTWRELRSALDAFLSAGEAALADPRPIHALVDDQRCRKAFDKLGIRTVGEFLATPKETLLAVKGFGRRSYDRVLELVGSTASERDLTGLPPSLLRLPLDTVGLEEQTVRTLTAFGDDTVGAVLARPASVWTDADSLRALAEHLDGLVAHALGTDTTKDEATGDTSTTRDLHQLEEIFDVWLAARSADDQTLFRARLGLLCTPSSTASLALRWNVEREVLVARESAMRESLLACASSPLRRLRIELARDLEAFGGLLQGSRIAGNTAARRLARRTSDPSLPLRLLAFVFPDSFYLVDGYLTDQTPSRVERATSRIELVLRGGGVRLPYSLERLADAVENTIGAIPQALLEHLVVKRLGLAIHLDPGQGEMIVRRRLDLARRVEALLREAEHPMSLDDLVFAHRDRFRSTRRAALADVLLQDSRFVQLGKDLWALREFHLDELEFIRAEAERISELIRTHSEQKNVHALYEDQLSNRGTYLLIDLLRDDPALRDLGRGVFCSRQRRRSSLVNELCRQLKRAMGEVPMERFVQNQPPRNRRLTIRLLERNRLFVSPEPDRVDLLENYPFTSERMRRLLNTVDVHMEGRGEGWATIESILDAVQQTDLGGVFLTEHMLLDLLRRNGGSLYEFLCEGRIIARVELGLSAWIQRRTRDVLRQCSAPLTPQQVLVEQPDLAEFAEAIQSLMTRDPLLFSEDGLSFRLV